MASYETFHIFKMFLKTDFVLRWISTRALNLSDMSPLSLITLHCVNEAVYTYSKLVVELVGEQRVRQLTEVHFNE